MVFSLLFSQALSSLQDNKATAERKELSDGRFVRCVIALDFNFRKVMVTMAMRCYGVVISVGLL